MRECVFFFFFFIFSPLPFISFSFSSPPSCCPVSFSATASFIPHKAAYQPCSAVGRPRATRSGDPIYTSTIILIAPLGWRARYKRVLISETAVSGIEHTHTHTHMHYHSHQRITSGPRNNVHGSLGVYVVILRDCVVVHRPQPFIRMLVCLIGHLIIRG